MGCDIHCYAERRTTDGYECLSDAKPFDWRSYGMYGFLANVRNYSAVPPISMPRNLPVDMSPDVRAASEAWASDGHSHSWLSVAELLAFDYNAEMEDRREVRQVGPNAWDGGCTADRGNGKRTTFREFLGEAYFADLIKLRDAEADRIVFWFDN